MVVGIPDKTSIKLSLFQNQNLTLNWPLKVHFLIIPGTLPDHLQAI